MTQPNGFGQITVLSKIETNKFRNDSPHPHHDLCGCFNWDHSCMDNVRTLQNHASPVSFPNVKDEYQKSKHGLVWKVAKKHTNYFLRVIPNKWHLFDIFSDILSGNHILSSIFSDILSGILSGISSEILCGWGPAGNTLIRSSRLRSGGEHSDPELAVRVRRGKLRSSACSWGPAEEKEKEKEKEEAGQLTWNLTTLTWQVGKKKIYIYIIYWW